MATASWLRQLQASFTMSIGDIVFGMEDGTVSIFGLVAGVALSSESSQQVLLAGSSGAIAAAVSMMAGVFLDLQSERDQARVEAKRQMAAIQANPSQAIAVVMGRLQHSGLSQTTLDAIQADLKTAPPSLLDLSSALNAPTLAEQQKPLIHALWMFVSDLFAGLTPVLAFAFLPLAQARWVSLLLTVVLLVGLGYGRARIGQRAILPAVLQTVGIAGLAAIAGVVIGRVIATHF